MVYSFVEFSVHIWSAPRQGGIAEGHHRGKTVDGRQKAVKQHSEEAKQQVTIAVLFLSLMFYPGYTRIEQVVLTLRMDLPIFHIQNYAKPNSG